MFAGKARTAPWEGPPGRGGYDVNPRLYRVVGVFNQEWHRFEGPVQYHY